MENIAFGGWANTARVTNGKIELIVTGDVGPRVIRLGFVGGANEFAEYADQMGKTDGNEWRIYGGHRLWHAPEHPVRTYFADNNPVTLTEINGGLRVTQPIESTTGIEKQMDIQIAQGRNHVHVVHRMTNHTLWPLHFASWALSVMAQDGVAVLPLPPRGEHPRDLLPANRLIMWPYTDMSDPRWTWGREYILLRQDRARGPQKVGATIPDGWIAYANGGRLFVKLFHYEASGDYPDMGACVESFTNQDMLEMETLGPNTTIQPGGSVEHIEDWFLFDGVPMPTDDASVKANVLPRVREAQAALGG
jgi:hypothetical protein